MSDPDTDYRAVNTPDEKPPVEYSYVERRAEILELIEEAGHPDALRRTRLADRYDVNPSTITRDFDRLGDYVRDTLGHQRHAISASLYRKAIKEYTDRGDYDKAIDALESWNEWLREEGARDTEPDEHDVDVSGGILAPPEAANGEKE
jgi:hypothetical protein